jgi:hypothetical protein
MSESDLKQALEKLEGSVTVPPIASATAPLAEAEAKRSFSNEGKMLADRHDRDMADRDEAREQRRRYARRVFSLVCVWITAIFVLLLLQSFGSAMVPRYRPLSDSVLIALISSTTVNLIGTLILVLKYIFRVPNPTDHKKHRSHIAA